MQVQPSMIQCPMPALIMVLLKFFLVPVCYTARPQLGLLKCYDFLKRRTRKGGGSQGSPVSFHSITQCSVLLVRLFFSMFILCLQVIGRPILAVFTTMFHLVVAQLTFWHIERTVHNHFQQCHYRWLPNKGNGDSFGNKVCHTGRNRAVEIVWARICGADRLCEERSYLHVIGRRTIKGIMWSCCVHIFTDGSFDKQG